MPGHRALFPRTENVGNDCLWDLRRGDADDNRASLYGRGWRGVLVSTVLEFNFLTATLAFLTLVVVPVLLVGLTPPLILICSRHKLDAATTISSHPLAAIVSIALLMGVDLWMGKPLLLMAAPGRADEHAEGTFAAIFPKHRVDRPRHIAIAAAAVDDQVQLAPLGREGENVFVDERDRVFGDLTGEHGPIARDIGDDLRATGSLDRAN